MRTINYEFCALFGICSFIVLISNTTVLFLPVVRRHKKNEYRKDNTSAPYHIGGYAWRGSVFSMIKR